MSKRLEDKDIELTKENVMEFREWLGNLAARALMDIGYITFFIDPEGFVRMEISPKTNKFYGEET